MENEKEPIKIVPVRIPYGLYVASRKKLIDENTSFQRVLIDALERLVA